VLEENEENTFEKLCQAFSKGSFRLWVFSEESCHAGGAGCVS